MSVFLVAAMLLSAAVSAEDYPYYKKALDAYNHQIYLGAVSEARTQLQNTPNHTPSLFLIARAYLKLKKCSDAGNAVITAINMMGDQVELQKILAEMELYCGASLELGRVYVQSKDYEKAAVYYRGYLQRNPGHLEARLDLARILSWAKDYPGAMEHYQRYLESRPKDMKAILGLADVYAWSGDLRSAESQLNNVLSSDPKNGEAHVKMGRVYEWQGKFKEAKEEYEKAASLLGNSEDVRAGLQRVKGLSAAPQRTTPSSAILNEIEQTGDVSLYLKLGDALYHNEGKVEEALNAYRRYVKRFPEDHKAQIKLARALSWEKKYEEAALLFSDYLKKYPADNAVRLEFANVLGWQGKYSAALSELDILKKKNPYLPAAYIAAGDIYRWQRNYPEARDNYKKALTLDSENVEAQERLRDIGSQWSTKPSLHLEGEGISMDDIDFTRTSVNLRADFHLDSGRVDLSPGFKNHRFEQKNRTLEATEYYFSGAIPIQNQWEWWGSAGAIKFQDHSEQFQGSIGIEGSLTNTWLRMGYMGQDAVFETNNLSALLNLSTVSLRLDNYNVEFAQRIAGENELKGLVSAGFFSDTNSRTRILLKGLHQLSEAPIVKFGPAYKSLSFAHNSPFYWSPSSYAGPGLTAEMERRWEAFSYKVGLQVFRIKQNTFTNAIAVTETAVEGGFFYRPSKSGYFGELTFQFGRGAGASIQGTPNTKYAMLLLNTGYKF